MFGKLEDN